MLKRRLLAHRRGRRAARPGGPGARGRAGRAAARPAGQIGGSMRAGWPTMTWIRSPSRRASSGSWVTSSTVRPASSCAASAWRRARVIASSAENGSSISTTGRSSISVRASAARWRWPPESVAGSWSRWRERPTRASSASARARSGALAAQPRAERDVLQHRQPGQQVVLLAHPGEPSGQRPAVAARDLALFRRHQPGDQAQQAALADPARAEQAGALAAREG